MEICADLGPGHPLVSPSPPPVEGTEGGRHSPCRVHVSLAGVTPCLRVNTVSGNSYKPTPVDPDAAGATPAKPAARLVPLSGPGAVISIVSNERRLRMKAA